MFDEAELCVVSEFSLYGLGGGGPSFEGSISKVVGFGVVEVPCLPTWDGFPLTPVFL